MPISQATVWVRLRISWVKMNPEPIGGGRQGTRWQLATWSIVKQGRSKRRGAPNAVSERGHQGNRSYQELSTYNSSPDGSAPNPRKDEESSAALREGGDKP
ncbi:hypothetical protein BKA70DRAFT_1229364 [Coprinopsis sp. MPI-PUGE-AT-0042]|nr:hypothetical protein BKA70DRAFT_1229364 [Coprinopsis sp. MPI-PUGE-AT-0042]